MDTLYHLDICLKKCGLSWKHVVSVDGNLGFGEVSFSTRESMNLKKLVYDHVTIREVGPTEYKMKLLTNRAFDAEVLAKLQQEGRKLCCSVTLSVNLFTEARFETLLKNRTFVSGPSLGEELVRLASMYGVTSPVVTLKLSENK